MTLPQNLTSTAAVMFTFDDYIQTVYTDAWAKLKTVYGRGTFYVHTAIVGTVSTYIQWHDLKVMDFWGWSIANHTRNHLHLDTLTQEEAEAEITGGEDDLVAQGLPDAAQHLAYPYGGYNATVNAAAQAAGMLTGRLASGGIATPTGNLFEIPITRAMDAAYSLDDYKSDVDTAKANNRLCVFLIHSLPGNITVQDFSDLVDYIVAQGLPMITIEDFYNSAAGPVTVPIGA